MKTNLHPRLSILAATLATCAQFSILRPMRAGTSLARTTCPKTIAERLRAACTMGLLPLLLCALPPAVQAQFTFVTNNGAITITGYTGPGGDVTIPSTTNGLPVTSIGNSAFSSKTTLTSITIPGSVTSIGNSAFYGCTGLTNASLGSGVVSIGPSAFRYCSKLAGIVAASGTRRSPAAPAWPVSPSATV